MVGEQGQPGVELLPAACKPGSAIPEEGRRFDRTKPQEVYLTGVGRDFYLLALMDLFGLLEVEQPRRPVTPWCPAGVKHVPFGDAVFTLLPSRVRSPPSATISSRRTTRTRRKGRRRCLASGPGSRCSSRISRNGGRT